MFRQVAEYSITTHQRVGKNSFKPALLAILLALLLAQFGLEIPRIIAQRPCSNSVADIRHSSVRSTQQASADVVSVVFTRLCPRLWLLRATSRRQAKMIPEFLRLPSLGC